MSDPKLQDDPSTYFAAERTFLAWIRTGLALMGVGFAVARFGMFLREMQATPGHGNVHSTGVSVWSGVALVLVGVAITVKSVVDHLRLVRELRDGTWVPGRVSRSSVLLGGLLAVVGLAMAVYLIVIR
jgi:putative membrane protein